MTTTQKRQLVAIIIGAIIAIANVFDIDIPVVPTV